ncbi:MAG: nucleotide exchange factor GrpE [Chloroflexota bacterium]
MKKEPLPEEVTAENDVESRSESEMNEQPVNELLEEEQDLEGEKPIEELTVEEQLVAMEARAAEYEAKAAEYLDGWQRARAEFANARKRLERQRAEAYNNAAVDYAKKLLPILDDFDRAIENAPPEIKDNDWFQGITLVQRKLNGILDDLNVQRIEAVGQPFDPNFHEALALMEADGVESGLVIEELQIGYCLGDRVIRPALVNVSA